MKKSFLMVCITIVALSFASAALAKKYTCKIALIHSEDLYKDSGYPTAVVFKNIVEAQTGGEIEVKIYPNSQLGKETEAMEGLQIGTIQIASPSVGAASKFVPEMYSLNFPFMFNNHLEAWQFYDSDFVKEAMKPARENGFRYIGQTDDGGGFVCLTNSKHPVKKPSDLSDIKMRDLEHPGKLAFWKALGVSATPIPWEELYISLQTGVVDGQSNGFGIISWAKLWEVQKYATLLKHYYGSLSWFVSEKWFQKLPEKYQEVIVQAMDEAKWAGRGVVSLKNITGAAEATEHGMEVYYPTAEEIDAFRALGQPAYVNWVKEKTGSDLVDKALVEIDKIRAQNKVIK
jgi:tripartite ATP-independent transporter DctP family solute receptor